MGANCVTLEKHTVTGKEKSTIVQFKFQDNKNLYQFLDLFKFNLKCTKTNFIYQFTYFSPFIYGWDAEATGPGGYLRHPPLTPTTLQLLLGDPKAFPGQTE